MDLLEAVREIYTLLGLHEVHRQGPTSVMFCLHGCRTVCSKPLTCKKSVSIVNTVNDTHRKLVHDAAYGIDSAACVSLMVVVRNRKLSNK